MAEGHDWTTTVSEPCPTCGFDAAGVETDSFDPTLRFEAMAWSGWLGSTERSALTAHPVEGQWSALEYACHVRDVFAVFAERVDKLRESVDAELGWWDHEAAVADETYNSQDVTMVAKDLSTNASILSAATIDIEGDLWNRSAERRPGEVFSIADLVRFALHESFHHRADATELVRLAQA